MGAQWFQMLFLFLLKWLLFFYSSNMVYYIDWLSDVKLILHLVISLLTVLFFIIKGCWILTSALSTPTEMIMHFFLLDCINMTVVDLKKSYIHKKNPMCWNPFIRHSKLHFSLHMLTVCMAYASLLFHLSCVFVF